MYSNNAFPVGYVVLATASCCNSCDNAVAKPETREQWTNSPDLQSPQCVLLGSPSWFILTLTLDDFWAAYIDT